MPQECSCDCRLMKTETNVETKPHASAQESQPAGYPACLDPGVGLDDLMQGFFPADMIEKLAEVYDVKPLYLSAAFFHTLAAARGASLKARVGAATLPVGFNLATVGDHHMAPQWMRTISGVFTQNLQRKIKGIQEELSGKVDAKLVKQRNEERARELQARQRVNLAATVTRYVRATRKSIVGALVLHGTEPSRMERAILLSPDFHVLLDNPPTGFLEEVRTLDHKRLRQLGGLLVGGEDADLLCPHEGFAFGGVRLRLELSAADVVSFMQIPQLRNSETLFLPASSQAGGAVDVPEAIIGLMEQLIELWFDIRMAAVANGGQSKRLTWHGDERNAEFVGDLREWERSPANHFRLPVQWLARLAWKLATLHYELPTQDARDEERSLRFGLELTKYLGRRHLKLLMSVLAAPQSAAASATAATADLSDRERSVYLRICQYGPISAIELGRSFHRMASRERDRILAKLLERGLVRFEADRVRQSAASSGRAG